MNQTLLSPLGGYISINEALDLTRAPSVAHSGQRDVMMRVGAAVQPMSVGASVRRSISSLHFHGSIAVQPAIAANYTA